MGGKRFTKVQEDWLIDNFQNYSDKSELAVAFNEQFNTNRSLSSIQNKTYNMNLIKYSAMVYTPEHDRWLEENYPIYSKKELAKAFNEEFDTDISYNALVHRTVRLNLKDVNKFYDFSDEEVEWLKDNALRWSSNDLTDKFNEKFNRNASYAGMYFYLKKELDIVRPKPKCNLYRDTSLYKIGEISYGGGKVQIRTKDGWVLYGRYLLEQKIGRKLKEDECVVFLDGNNRNFDLNNLELATIGDRAILARNNWNGKGEITRTGIYYARLRQTLSNIKKEIE